MLTGAELLAELKGWVASRGSDLSAVGLQHELTESPEDRNPQSIWWILESDDRLAEIILWSNGHAELQFAEVASGEISAIMRELATEEDVQDALNSIVEWMTLPVDG
ncbi:hypothetical protein ACFYY8_38140 [Streptosporangium sp. NPDC001559]|uniref:immunity protein TriTu family protein n=1 Tax=Streptosporangium sp. NPDC001559 TaxID=3366187 RepID=UPI0036EEF1B0